MKQSLRIAAAVLFWIGATTAVGQSPPVTAQRSVSIKALNLSQQFGAGTFAGPGQISLSYRYFDPITQGSKAEKFPVILYLHGEDEAGADNVAQLTTTDNATVWMEPHHLAQNPAYVLAPQLPVGAQWTQEPHYASTMALLNEFMKSHPRADTNRIYVVGFSMGATGLYTLLLRNPELFASAMPISGSADAWLNNNEAWAAVKNTPIIIVHAYDDNIVPVSKAQSAISALQANGNNFLNGGSSGYVGPTPSLWTPGSTPIAHEAWWTAFEKFEVIYNSLFWGDLARTQRGQINPTTLYQHRQLADGLIQVWDYALGTSFVLERNDKAVIIDTTMGNIGKNGGIYQYIRDHVLKNRNIDIEVFVTHDHGDHTEGLRSFIGASQLKAVYVHEGDSAVVRRVMGPDAAKIKFVKDGDRIPLGGKYVEVIHVPGHTIGSIIMKHENNLFSGDTIGTGYVGVGRMSIEDYVVSLEHLLNKMGTGHYNIYGGHTGEVTAPVNERYVQDLLVNARGIVAGTLVGTPYWRAGALATRKVSTVGGSSITYSFTNIRRIEGALYNIETSGGALNFGFAWRDAGFTSDVTHYRTRVAESVSAFDIRPVVLHPDYRRLTVNGSQIKSGETFRTDLKSGSNRFEIEVTAANGATLTYTLDVMRGAQG